ncbi:lysylphosphatidylglycerol synthase transmembrane domain-containing protein [Compostibacter hankyongensis]|uniref:Lysylphosphatidylglycerol synthase transmembrane domain-containing protein n=1 Tax=Compostibacter hankyongensis TaxID=1007089 RepID=A0ABP8FPJ1_9BACT
MNKWLKWTLKIVVTAAALYLTFRKVQWRQTATLLLSADGIWLLPALLFYNASQWASAWRLQYFYGALELFPGFYLNLRLYYRGMFYNLFLPGGIGGDGYKIHYLFRRYHKPVRELLTATLLDRVNGLIVLGLLIVLIAGSGLLPQGLLPFPAWLLPVAYLLGMVLFAALLRRFLARYFEVLPRTTLISGLVQGLQLTAMICLMKALHIHGPLLPYLLLFLSSSIAAVIPFTIGGMGARELVFMAGAPLLGAVPAQAIAVSLLFFLLTAVSSLAGGFISARNGDNASS